MYNTSSGHTTIRERLITKKEIMPNQQNRDYQFDWTVISVKQKHSFNNNQII